MQILFEKLNAQNAATAAGGKQQQADDQQYGNGSFGGSRASSAVSLSTRVVEVQQVVIRVWLLVDQLEYTTQTIETKLKTTEFDSNDDNETGQCN